MKISPVGYRVLIKPDKVEETTEGGIIIHTKEEDLAREQAATTVGTLVAIGESAWANDPVGRWAKVGDRVVYAKYSGKNVYDSENGVEYIICNDEDIVGVVHE